MPEFYFAIGRAPAAQDWEVCRLVGQRQFLVPAGSLAERTLRTMPDVSVIIDSGAYPPGNPDRPMLEQYWWIVRWWSKQLGRFAWAASYDTLGDPARSARDHDRLLDQPWRWPDDIPVVRVLAYPHHTAGDILAEVNDTLKHFDDEELEQYRRLLAAGELAAHNGRPACAVGGLAVARYAEPSRRWYRRLLSDLEAMAGTEVDVSHCRLHLLGIGRPDWVCHPLVQSFDSSAPARLASIGAGRLFAGTMTLGSACRSTACNGAALHALRTSSATTVSWPGCPGTRLMHSCCAMIKQLSHVHPPHSYALQRRESVEARSKDWTGYGSRRAPSLFVTTPDDGRLSSSAWQ